MKRYALLLLFPPGNFQPGNKVIDETVEVSTLEIAISKFQKEYPKLGLDHDGYAKTETGITYCVAEAFDP